MEVQGNQLRLKLMRPNRIKQNLRPLVQNTKKKVAQNLYYQNHPTHQSPLIREEKEPVHQRLGMKRLTRLPLGTSTATLLPKRKLRPPMVFRQNKLTRIYSAQSRLERIRSQQNNNNGLIKLRRLNRGPAATNLTVEVHNPNFAPSHNGFGPKFGGFYKFKMILNSSIQAEISDIQKNGAGSVVSYLPLTRVTPVATPIGMSERFGMLSFSKN